MAKKPSRRRRVRLLKGNVEEALVLGTLAAATLVGANYDETVNERSIVLSHEATWSVQNLTADEGPIVVGIAHSDYSDAEIEETIENTGSWNEGNLVDQEIAKRKIRTVGVFQAKGEDEALNDGLPVKTSLKWVLLQGQTLKMWAYNRTSATLTTGAIVIIQGHAWIKPL